MVTYRQIGKFKVHLFVELEIILFKRPEYTQDMKMKQEVYSNS